MATALKLKSDIKKLKAAINSKATPKSFLPKLKNQLERAEGELKSLKEAPKGGKPRKSTSAGTEKTLSALQKLVNKKKYSIYKGKGVDLKKDAAEGAFAAGRRVSKGLKANQEGPAEQNKGNVYYEYRPNRLDVKQPRKKQTYPKLEDGGILSKEDFLDEIYDMAGSILVVERSSDVQLSTNNRSDLNPFIKKYAEFGKAGYGLVSEIDEVKMDGETYYYLTIKYPKLADGGEVGAKYKVGDEVYSYQNKDNAAPVAYVKFVAWDSKSGKSDKDKYVYKLKLSDGYTNWIDEKSISKSKMADGGMMARGGEVRYKLKGSNFGQQVENGQKFKTLISKVHANQTGDNKYPENFIKEIAFTEKIVKSNGSNYLKDYAYKGTLTKFEFLDDKDFIEALSYVDRPAIRKFEEGGMFEKPIAAVMDNRGNVKSQEKLQRDLEYLRQAYEDKIITKEEYDKEKNETEKQIKLLRNKEKGGYMASGGEMHRSEEKYADGGQTKKFSELEFKEIIDEALEHLYMGLNKIEGAMRYLEVRGQAGLKNPFAAKIGLSNLKESIEKIDEYTSKK